MPSPLGHALGGIAAAWGMAPRRDVAAAAVLAAVAVAPDLDLLVHNHRGESHSVGMALVAGALAWVIASAWPSLPRRRDRLSWAVAVMLAYGSHILLDWLSNDTRPPLGVMALWPFSRDYFKAGIEVFPPVSRRYWESRFWIYNLRALAMEVLIMAPVTALILRIVPRRRQ